MGGQVAGLQSELRGALVDAAETLQDAVEELARLYGVHVSYYLAHTPEQKHDEFFVRTTYPLEWVGRYVVKGYVNVDPIIREGFARLLPFDWREVEMTDEAAELMADAVRHGLHPNGYCWPLVDKHGRRALLSVNGPQASDAWDRFMDDHKEELGEIATTMHARAIREVYGEEAELPALSKREIECLYWTAQGKSSTVIADILGISPHTVRVYLKNIRSKLNVASLRSAVVKAQKLRLLDPA